MDNQSQTSMFPQSKYEVIETTLGHGFSSGWQLGREKKSENRTVGNV